ncbi:MAG: hypothetical protein ACRDRJ_31830 [Streptosporangiaceae bacterium]
MSTGEGSLRLEQRDEGWVLGGSDASRFGLVNEYLGYLKFRSYAAAASQAASTARIWSLVG